MEKIALGGGCHWCTEAVFQKIKGVHHVDQGFVSSYGDAKDFSEGVVIFFDPAITQLQTLIRVHLKTHSSTSNHTRRDKYRSAIYYYSEAQEQEANRILKDLSHEYPGDIITKVLPFRKFEPSVKKFHNYYINDPDKPFCRRYIEPKLEIIRKKFREDIKE